MIKLLVQANTFEEFFDFPPQQMIICARPYSEMLVLSSFKNVMSRLL